MSSISDGTYTTEVKMTKLFAGVASLVVLGGGLFGVFYVAQNIPAGSIDYNPLAWGSLAIAFAGLGLLLVATK